MVIGSNVTIWSRRCSRRLKGGLLTNVGPVASRQSRVLILALSLIFAACSTSNNSVSDPPIYEMGKSIEWFENADPEQDAVTAIGYGDLRLIALALRSLSVPGIDAALKQDYVDKCGFRLVPGVDDVIRNKNDLRFLKIAREYALAYNNIVVAECASAQ